MQANKDQDWTADADFWDEAWADMNTRLDDAPGRRKGLLVWWKTYLATAAGLVLALKYRESRSRTSYRFHGAWIN